MSAIRNLEKPLRKKGDLVAVLLVRKAQQQHSNAYSFLY
jgi:hypothetical protein